MTEEVRNLIEQIMTKPMSITDIRKKTLTIFECLVTENSERHQADAIQALRNEHTRTINALRDQYAAMMPSTGEEAATSIVLPGLGMRRVPLKEYEFVRTIAKQDGKKIQAIKAARDFWNIGLKEAKDFVESL